MDEVTSSWAEAAEGHSSRTPSSPMVAWRTAFGSSLRRCIAVSLFLLAFFRSRLRVLRGRGGGRRRRRFGWLYLFRRRFGGRRGHFHLHRGTHRLRQHCQGGERGLQVLQVLPLVLLAGFTGIGDHRVGQSV